MNTDGMQPINICAHTIPAGTYQCTWSSDQLTIRTNDADEVFSTDIAIRGTSDTEVIVPTDGATTVYVRA